MNKNLHLGLFLAVLLSGAAINDAAAQRDSSNGLQRFFEAGNYPKNPLPALRHGVDARVAHADWVRKLAE